MPCQDRNKKAIRLPQNASIAELIDGQLDKQESPKTARTIQALRRVRKSRGLSKADLEEVCRWKSPRAISLIRQNEPARIRRITKLSFATRDEEKRIALLTTLRGVGIPMASAILMLTGPKRYGVIDIRVWQLLYALGSVQSNPRGRSLTSVNWHEYLMILRHHAKRLNVTARDVERSLFMYHKKAQRVTCPSAWCQL